MPVPFSPPDPMPPEAWDSLRVDAGDAPLHAFPARPEVHLVTAADLAERGDGPIENEGYWPEHLPRHPVPELLRPEQRRRPPWRRPPGQADDLSEPTSVFLPDDRAVIYDTSYPWCTLGRVQMPGGWGSGVMVGPRHMMTASHAIPWLPDGSIDWVTFTPMQYDSSTPFGTRSVVAVWSWQQVNGADGLSANETAFDYVVCVLDASPGTGSMGSRGYSSDWNGLVRWAHVGYPGDVGSGLRPVYTTNGVMDDTRAETSQGRNAFRIRHRNDANPGQSGGAYFGWWAGDQVPYVVATQSGENTGGAGGPNSAGGGNALPELVAHVLTVEP